MARQQYPLQALRKLRDERADAQAQALGRQVARSAAAAAALAEREGLRREHAQRTAETLRAERDRLAVGSASGADLLRLTEFETAARAQASALAQAEEQARQSLARERAEEQKARDELSRLEAEAKLARNHEASFHEQHASAAVKVEEEAALEQWSARRH